MRFVTRVDCWPLTGRLSRQATYLTIGISTPAHIFYARRYSKSNECKVDYFLGTSIVEVPGIKNISETYSTYLQYG